MQTIILLLVVTQLVISAAPGDPQSPAEGVFGAQALEIALRDVDIDELVLSLPG
jgi:hypothetical protein